MRTPPEAATGRVINRVRVSVVRRAKRLQDRAPKRSTDAEASMEPPRQGRRDGVGRGGKGREGETMGR